ncbi:hypothetical protein FHR83_004691 [Actinoplanes campanulatus]|uniref:DUF397 domain-containing protein n=2 Tax=Actinoplanes campanulatus TaxID=113559 RepID=A0A7W5FFZ8_9ACTN|nr:hypothetical protein [Actinoplanes campanulatus]GGN15067.1 toxin [Actinoplanes campanulatus]GID37802.1 toxin [Actinoplanes campanulatus]
MTSNNMTWRKSSRSTASGDCVEVGTVWRKSSRSSANGDCVEVADNLPDVVAVRDSKDRDGGTLTFTTAQWTAFIGGIKNGEF